MDFVTTAIILLFTGLFLHHFWKLNRREIDDRGYIRNGYGRLIHRDVAYHYHYKKGFQNGKYKMRFRYYDVHHVDEDKTNNSPKNLQILTRAEHRRIHGR